jgi:hypothetical protein
MNEEPAPLTDQMANALRGKEFITNRGDRIRAYCEARVSLANIPDKEWREADEAALSEELSRRLVR